MTIKLLQDLLLSLGVACRIRCVGAGGWTVALSWESGASVIATGADLQQALVNALSHAKDARPLTDEEQLGLERTFEQLRIP